MGCLALDTHDTDPLLQKSRSQDGMGSDAWHCSGIISNPR